MVHWQNILAATATAAASSANSLATNLFVTSYTGTVTTYGLSCASTNSTTNSYTTTLPALHTDRNCGASPSWLTFDADRRILYCLDEGLSTPNGSMNSYTVARDGTLAPISHLPSIVGPVSAALYSSPSGEQYLAAAHYSGSAVSAWAARDNATLAPAQQITFEMAEPGPIASRQDAPHEHEAVLDPTGRFVLVPDLGADVVRVFSVDEAEGGALVQKESLEFAPGTGPRHVAFLTGGAYNQTYLYVVTELTNLIISYAVSYPPAGGMSFKEVYRTSSFGTQKGPEGATAAEITVSPDKRFLVVSNRNDTTFSLPNPDANNSTALPSDSLATFAIRANGTLGFEQLSPAGGSTPRHFALNARGDRVAVALQDSDAVVVWKRDVKTGVIGDVVARMEVGQPTSVLWDEVGCVY